MPIIGASATIAVLTAACVGVFIAAEPRYVSLCATDGSDCVTASLTKHGVPDTNSQLAVVSLDKLSEVSLTNRNATGETKVSVVGFFSGASSAADLGQYSPAEASDAMTIRLGTNETRHIELPDTPRGAQAALVQIRGSEATGTDTSAAAAESGTATTADAADTAARPAADATAAASAGSTGSTTENNTTVKVSTGGTDITTTAVKRAIRHHHRATSSPTATPSAEATDAITKQIVKTAAPTKTTTSTGTGTSTAAPTSSKTVTAPAAPAAPAAPPAPAAPAAPVKAAPAPAAPAAPAPAPVVVAPASTSGTGVPAGTPLKVVSGDQTVTAPGTVLDGLDIHGRVIVKAANVTIKNSIVRGLDSGGAGGLVDAMSGAAGLQIQDTEIVATTPSYQVNGIMGSNFELHRVNIHNTVDQVDVAGSNVVVADSWLHGTTHYVNDPSHADGSHDDNIQIVGGDNIHVTGNVMQDAQNTAMMITQDRSTVSNVNIAGNKMDNGDCIININPKGGSQIQGLAVTGNSFGLHASISRCAVYSPSNPVAMSGNSWADGLAALLRTS